MKKGNKAFLLAIAMVMSLSVVAMADVGSVVQGQSASGTRYSGYVEGSTNSSGCYAATTSRRVSGSEGMYAYVEIVDGDGYTVGPGSVKSGGDYAYSGTISRGTSGVNAYGSCGTVSGSSRTFARLY